MAITEFTILVFKSPSNPSDLTLQPLFQKLSTWQSECSGFPLRFFKTPGDTCQIHLMTGWRSVAAHETWISGERNQALLRLFGPYVDMPRIRMVHLDVDFEAIPDDAAEIVIERYGGQRAKSMAVLPEESNRSAWSLVGRDLAEADGDVFRIVGAVGSGGSDIGGRTLVPVERWVLKRVGW